MQSVDQLRDRLAEAMGWTRLKDLPTFWRRSKGKERDRNDHPVTVSLDWLAAHGLPEGWRWVSITQMRTGVWQTVSAPKGKPVFADAPTELHARLAACVAAWEAKNERTKP